MNLTQLFFAFFLLIAGQNIKAQSIINGGFEEFADDGSFKNWKWSKSPGFNFLPELDKSIEGKYCARLSSTVGNKNGGAAFVQTFTGKISGLKRVRYSMMIKTRDAGPVGFILNAFCGRFNVYSNSELPSTTILGTNDWKQYSLEATLPTYTNALSFVGKLGGVGTAWFDDVKLEEIPLIVNPLPDSLANLSAEFLNVLDKYSVRRDSFDVKLLKKDIEAMSQGAVKKEDLGYGFLYAFAATGDKKAKFADGKRQPKIKNEQIAYPVAGVYKEKYAVVRIPSFYVLDTLQRLLYVDSLTALIKSYDKSYIRGIMLDFRNCTQGDEGALFRGLAPFLKDQDTVLTFAATNAPNRAWRFNDSSIYNFKHHIPVAVLTSYNTGGAGEVAAIAFKHQKNVRVIGEPTAGLSTRTTEFQLSTGWVMQLSTGVFSDRTGKKYLERVEPDEFSNYPKDIKFSIDEDPVIFSAVQWFKTKGKL